MSQTPTSSCSHCGTTVPANMRFCPNCGAPQSAPAAGTYERTQLSTPPPPPQTYYPPEGQQGYQPQQQHLQGPPPAQAPAYAKPQKDSSKGVLGQIGCGVGIVILLIVLALGTVGYLGYRWITGKINTVSSTITSVNGANGTGTPTFPMTTTTLNTSLTYASLDITVVNAQQASTFADDTNGSTPVIVRLNLKEHNPTANTISPFYGDNFRLILPGGTSITPGSEHDSGSVDQAVNRTNWVDFPLTAKADIGKLILRIGAPTEAQMDVPLIAKTDLSKYQPKTINPNTAFTYAGLKWTITSVTASLSASGKQADTGKRFIVVHLRVDNPTQNPYYPFPSDDIRLQAGSTISPPTDSTFDTTIPAGTTGTNAIVTFLVPQDGSPLNLVMLARTDTTPAASQVSTAIQI